MGGLTPLYGFPYASLGDSPNGAAQEEALARAIETKISSVDTTNNTQTTNISAIQTTLNTLNMRNLGGRVAATAGVINAGIGATEVNIAKLQLENSSVTSGRVYVFHVTLNMLFTVVNDTFIIRVRKDTPLSGTIVASQFYFAQSTGTFLYIYIHRPWQAPSSDADADFYVSVMRFGGSGVTDVRGDSESAFWIDEIVTPTDWQFVP